MKKTLSLLVAVIMLLALSVPAFAAGVTINYEQTGSLTMYKYDMTSATGNGIELSSFVATGAKDTAAEAALAPYAIQGVKFTYLKVADISNQTTAPEEGKADVSLLYGMVANDKTAALLTALGLSYDDAYTNDGTTYYYTSDKLNHAVNTVMADSTAAKNVLENYIKANGGTTMVETDANGYTSASGLPLGLYLIVETYVPENVTCTVNPFFVSIPMTTTNGLEWMYDITLYPKNETGNPTLEKLVRESTEDTGKTEDYAHTATASIGDVVDYQIVSKLPTVTSEASYLTTYTYVDTLSKGIAYNKEDVTISYYTDAALTREITSWTEADGKFTVTYGTAANDATTMTIAMTGDGLTEINASKTVYPAGSVASGYSTCYMVIRYSCTLNEYAVIGDAGNPNEVELTWKRTNTEYYDTLNDDCHVYTYGIDLLKKFHDENDADADGNFANVKFVLRNDTDTYFVVADLIDGVYYAKDHVAEKADATVFVPDADGKIIIKGLEDDVYYIKETATDSGYQLLADEIKVEIVAAESDTLCGVCGKALLTASAKVNDQDVTMLEDNNSVNALAPLTIINNHGFDLPPTGAQGTWLLSIIGVIGMAACAAVLIVLLRKRGKNEDAA
ncbi:MAG: SpaH/EbpB family LPXTG-anchored major pilin [Faecousia sp.]